MNKQLQLTVREWVLLLLLCVLGVGVAFYYWLWSPQLLLSADMRTELVAAEQKLGERQEWQARDAVTRASLRKLAAEQDLLQAEFDVFSHEYDLIDYLVELSLQTNCGVCSLGITPELLNLSVSATTFEQIHAFLQAIERCPNLAPVAASLRGGESSFSLELTAELTWGQLPPQAAQHYARTTPFGR